MSTITWGSSGTSANPPQVNSDVLSLSGLSTVQAQLTAHGTAGGGGMGLNGTVALQGSPDGSTWTTLASTTIHPGIGQSVTKTLGPVAVGSYNFARINFVFVTYDEGFFDAGTWTTTILILNVAKVSRGTTAALPNRPIAIGTPGNPNPYGVDIRCRDDLDPYFPLVGGVEVLAQDLYHSITCAPGSVPGKANTIDARAMISQGVTQSDLQTVQAGFTSTLQDDERVQQALVTLSFDEQTEELEILVQVLPLNPQGSAQPFQFVASISAIGSTLLSVSPIGS